MHKNRMPLVCGFEESETNALAIPMSYYVGTDYVVTRDDKFISSQGSPVLALTPKDVLLII